MTLRALLLILLTLAFAAGPLLFPAFNGYDAAGFPVQIDKPAAQPAGYAFSIWGVIYLWLIVHAIYGYFIRARSLDWDETRLPLIISIGIGILWLWIASFWPLIATALILGMWACALVAFMAADQDYDPWLLVHPLSVYAGWLSAAMLVSIGVVVTGYGLFAENHAALGVIAAVLVLVPIVQYYQPAAPLFSVTAAWALIAIVVANYDRYPFVALAAALVALAVLAAAYQLLRRARVAF